MGRLGNCKEEIETPMSEQEKTDFVSGKFLYAITDFSLFKRGEAYWLEYIGNDTYCCRSDNHLNEKIRINPCELTRYFSEEPLHSFENILSEFAYHVRTWGLTDGESNIDFCNVEAHRWAKEMINMKDCRHCKWIDRQLPSHCFKLGKILDDDELLSDVPCEDFMDYWDWLETKKPKNNYIR